MPELVLTAADDGRDLAVEIGAEIALALEENRTTGFLWQLAGPLPDGLVWKGDRFYHDAGPGLGRGGRRSFRFLAVAPGSGDIAFQLRRPWEIGLAPQARFRVGVTVR